MLTNTGQTSRWSAQTCSKGELQMKTIDDYLYIVDKTQVLGIAGQIFRMCKIAYDMILRGEY